MAWHLIISDSTLTKICYDLKTSFVWEKFSYGQWPGGQLKSSPYRDKIMNQEKNSCLNKSKQAIWKPWHCL